MSNNDNPNNKRIRVCHMFHMFVFFLFLTSKIILFILHFLKEKEALSTKTSSLLSEKVCLINH